MVDLQKLLSYIKKKTIQVLDEHKSNIGQTQISSNTTTQIGCPNNELTVLNALTVTTAGTYLCIGQATYCQNTKGYRILSLQRYYNDTNSWSSVGYIKTPTVQESTVDMQVHALQPLNLKVGDKIRLVGLQNSGSTLNVLNSYIILTRLK